MFRGSNNNLGAGVCCSIDGGDSWFSYEFTTENNWNEIITVAVHPVYPEIALAAGYETDDGQCFGAIFQTQDGGRNWIRLCPNQFSAIENSCNHIHSIVYDPYVHSTLYAGSDLGVYKSIDHGQNWVKLDTPFDMTKCLVVHPHAPHILFAGCRDVGGVFFSDDAGDSWLSMNDGLEGLQIDCMTINPADKQLFIGTLTGGMFRYDISAISDSVVPPEFIFPEGFVVYENYPNPFNRGTTIRYDIPEGNYHYFTLELYNTNGNLIKTLVTQIPHPGQYHAPWDGRDELGHDVGSGVYIARFKLDNYVKSRKMIVMR